MRLKFILMALTLVAGCSHIDTGQIDYRVVNTSEQSDPIALERRYGPSESEGDRPFVAQQVYSMEIEQAMMGDTIMEGRIFGQDVGHDAEIAILANVFEFAAADGDATQQRFLQSGEFDSRGSDPSDVELKLIYYGDDIRRGQPFNFSNIPLHPRSTYNGGSIGIQIVVIEVDSQSGPIRSLLGTLARFGARSIPVASEASDILLDLGESLFAGGGSGDDRLFEYRFVLSAASANPDAVQATFSPGRYVLRRTQVRETEQDWNNIRLNPNTGRLENNGGDELRNELYLVLNVRRYPDGTPPEFYAFDDWTDFRTSIQARVDDRTAAINNVTALVSESLIRRRSEQWRNTLINKWALAEARLQAFSARHILNSATFNFSTCISPSLSQAAVERSSQQAERDALDALRAFVTEYQMANHVGPDQAETRPTESGQAPPDQQAEFSESDRGALISRVARYFMPWSGDTEAHFANPDSFNNFVNDPANGLIAGALATAEAGGREASSCDDFRQ